jgi:hypothetical protein
VIASRFSSLHKKIKYNVCKFCSPNYIVCLFSSLLHKRLKGSISEIKSKNPYMLLLAIDSSLSVLPITVII